MTRHAVTQEDVAAGAGAGRRFPGPPRPGLLLVFSAGCPLALPVPLSDGALTIGREAPAFAALTDPLLSRRHAEVTYGGGQFHARDLGSRNGSSLDGEPLRGGVVARPGARVLRTGGTIFLLCPDLLPYSSGVQLDGGTVIGPTLHEAWDAIARAARSGDSLHLRGESGTGKELAARAFHGAGPRRGGPFVAVNCATIPEGVAERLLFGARKGAFSGATADADGYLQAADGGTLFLDEIGELQPPVQAKLLRVLELREVVPLGASQPQTVDLRFVSATHKDLRAEATAGRLRQDLYFRIGRPEVTLPPLRERLEEIPWLVASEVERIGAGLTAHASLVEACLLRPWPGNVRELAIEARAAAQAAIAAGSREVTEAHLSPAAGRPLGSGPPPDVPPAEAPASARPGAAEPRARRTTPPSREALEALLAKHAGVIQEVAGELGCSRRQVGRFIELHRIDRARFRAPAGSSPTSDE